MKKRMVKVPGPGQFRGEGEWQDFEAQYPMSHFLTAEQREERMNIDWEMLQNTQFLPTKEE